MYSKYSFCMPKVKSYFAETKTSTCMEHQNATAQQTIVVVTKQKSLAAAILLTIFFGPLGLLYSSVMGGIAMIVLGLLIGIFTLGVGLVIVWPICIVWAVVAVNMANKKQDKTLHR